MKHKSNCLVLDWFRSSRGDNSLLRRNLFWIYNYLYNARLFDKPVEHYSQPLQQVEAVFCAHRLDMNEFSWAYLYDYLNKFPLAYNFFLDTCDADLIIGYELSRAQLRALDTEGKTYINLCTHPIRFTPDYFLAASTNSPEIHTRLEAVGPMREYIDVNVRMAMARAARRYHKRLDTDEGLIFFAQTAVDASRISNGELVGTEFIISEIKFLLRELNISNFYIKSHPHEKIDPLLLSELTKLKGKEITTNTYDLLSVDNLKLCALSSGVCHEALYFNCHPYRFLEDDNKFPIIGEEAAIGQYLPLPANVYSREVWDYILYGGKEKPATNWPLPHTPYRAASGLAWG